MLGPKKQRGTPTDAEYSKLVTSCDAFCRHLAKIVARQLKQFPPEIWETVLMHLQEHTSLYAPYTYDRIKLALKESQNEKPSKGRW